MSDINAIFITGRIGRDAELKASKNGMSMVKLSVAVNSYKDKPANWFTVMVFGKFAEYVSKVAKRGTRVAVSGRMEIERYEKDGVEKTSLTVIANEVSILDDKKGGKATEGNGGTGGKDDSEEYTVDGEITPF